MKRWDYLRGEERPKMGGDLDCTVKLPDGNVLVCRTNADAIALHVLIGKLIIFQLSPDECVTSHSNSGNLASSSTEPNDSSGEFVGGGGGGGKSTYAHRYPLGVLGQGPLKPNPAMARGGGGKGATYPPGVFIHWRGSVTDVVTDLKGLMTEEQLQVLQDALREHLRSLIEKRITDAGHTSAKKEGG